MTSLTDIFVAVKPDMKSFGGDAKKALGAAAGIFRAAGKDAGKVYTDALAAASKGKIEELGKKAAAASAVQADALGKLRVAETRLSEVRGQAKVKASQIAAAEEAVASALRKSTTASGEAKTAASALTREQNKAKKAAEDAAKAQANGSGGLGSRLTQSFKSGFKPDASALNKIDGRREGKALATRFGLGFNGAFGGIVSKSGGLLAAGFAAVGIGSLVKDSVNLEATFSQTMSTMAAVAQVPAGEMKGLSDLALKMGADTTFSALEAGNAMLELAKGGLSAATIESGGLQGTLTLAAAGGLSLASASTIASNALNTFSLKGKDMGSVADALAGGANASTASVESLGIALGQVGPGATTAGLTLQQTVGVLAAFDNAGIKGSDAGTSLKTMLTRLVPQTDKTKGAMEDLGLKFTNANGSIVSITNVAQQLKDKLGGLSAEQRISSLNTLFGSDATRAATVLMNEGAVGLGKYIKATSDSGAAQKVAAARMSGTAGAMEQFKGSVETAKLQLGLFLAPAIQGGLRLLTDGVNAIVPGVKSLAAAIVSTLGPAFLSFTGFLKDNATTIGIVAGVIVTLLIPHFVALGIAALGSAAKQVLSWALTSAEALIAAVVHSGVVVGMVAGWVLVGAQALINGAKVAAGWIIAGGPIVWIIAGIVAIVAAIVVLWNKNDGFRNALISAWEAVKGAVSTAASAIVTAFMAIVGFLSSVWSAIYPIIALPVYIALAVIKGYIALLVAVFVAVKDFVIGVFSKAWSAVSGVLSGPINTAKTAIGIAFAAVRGVFVAVKDWVVGAFAVAWSVVQSKLTGPINTAKAAIGTALGATKGGIQWVFSQAVGAIGKIWDGLKTLAKAPIRFIVDTVLNNGLIDAFNWVADLFKAPTIKHIPLPAGFERGGRIPGQPSAKDNLVARGPDGPVGLATGEYVVNARQTTRNLPLLEAINRGMPGFAGGGLFGKLKDSVSSAFASGKNLASNAMDVLSDPVKWFKDKLSGPLGRMAELGNSPLVEVVKAVPRSLVNTITDKAKDLLGFGSAGAGGGGNGGSGVARWRDTALAALAAAGGPASWIDSLLRRMNQESGGDPNAINRWDSNAAAGHPSQGLMQTIPGTFNAYAGPYRSRGITDPFANIYAAIKYTMDRYGSGPAGWDRSGGYSQGGKVGSLLFDGGRGYLPTGTSLVQNNTGKPEPLTRTDQSLDLSDQTIRALGNVFTKALGQGKFRLVNSGGGAYVLQASNG